jgi:hypothetical protein
MLHMSMYMYRAFVPLAAVDTLFALCYRTSLMHPKRKKVFCLYNCR